LALSITRKSTSLELDIYHKPTATDTTINFHSNHPLEHKLAAYRLFINRMLSLPLNEVQRHKEWISIKQTARNNIPIHLLTKLRRKIQKKLNQPHLPTTSIQDTIWANFTHSSAHVRKITNLFKNTCQSYLQKQKHDCAVPWVRLEPRTTDLRSMILFTPLPFFLPDLPEA